MIQFIKNRLNETSTYLLVITGAGAASMMVYPWNIIGFVAHIVVAFLPDKKIVEDVLANLK